MNTGPYFIISKDFEFWLLFILSIGSVIGFWINRAMIWRIRISLIMPFVFFGIILVIAQLGFIDMATRGLLIKIALATIMLSIIIINTMWTIHQNREYIAETISSLWKWCCHGKS
jgi:uncharacterized membrane protein